MWNLEKKYFEVGAHILIVEVEENYFLIGLSRRGDPISLIGPRGGDVTTQGFIDQYYFSGTQMSGKKIPIKDVRDLPLRKFHFSIQRVLGSYGAHHASRDHMLYSLEAMASTVFNWKKPC